MKSKIKFQDIIIRPLRIEDYDALISLWNDAQLLYKPRGRDRRDNIERELRQLMAVFEKIFTYIRAGNREALYFYLRLGFRKVGRAKKQIKSTECVKMKLLSKNV
ncbi:hypothetical protein AMJ52_02545 [candidate division TA06 bacterium DG_78]|uniref:N-acetyltransferase domain-containing protein n=1 Tax=candidate division TA06 bacterium DG_78 TaxID=1703772 RepID=A0A0S7YGP8_UNCT6|nr:MAG: hypothetical protein AMJ52_02545 [candidate division TA06 bacterium DG_78]